MCAVVTFFLLVARPATCKCGHMRLAQYNSILGQLIEHKWALVGSLTLRILRKLFSLCCGTQTNSLLDGRAQPLADIEEFALKIKACKEAQTDPDFCVVARVEAFIAGWGLEEALKRATAYHEAGADAIVMHSKRSDPQDIQAFMEAWNNKVNRDFCHVIGAATYVLTNIDCIRPVLVQLPISSQASFI